MRLSHSAWYIAKFTFFFFISQLDAFTHSSALIYTSLLSWLLLSSLCSSCCDTSRSHDQTLSFFAETSWKSWRLVCDLPHWAWRSGPDFRSAWPWCFPMLIIVVTTRECVLVWEYWFVYQQLPRQGLLSYPISFNTILLLSLQQLEHRNVFKIIHQHYDQRMESVRSILQLNELEGWSWCSTEYSSTLTNESSPG